MNETVHVDGAGWQRCRGELSRLVHAGHDAPTLLDETVRLLATVIPCEAACWHLLDPATLIETSYRAFNLPLENPLAAEIEYLHEDYNQFAALARAPRHTAILSVATRGAPERSLRYRELLRPMGLYGELRSVFVDDGTGWGSVCLVRERTSADFTAREVSLLDGVVAQLGHGLHAAALLGAATAAQDEADGPGLVLFDGRQQLDSMTPAAERMLAELGDCAAGASSSSREVPYVVHAVAARARAAARQCEADAHGADASARAQVTAGEGRRIALHGCLLDADEHPRVAVVVERTWTRAVVPALVGVQSLTPREREVTRHLLQGYSTKQIARSLGISPYTVQEHCTAIFDKAGVRSRRELVGSVFRRFYDPRNAPARAGLPRGRS